MIFGRLFGFLLLSMPTNLHFPCEIEVKHKQKNTGEREFQGKIATL